MSCRRRILSLAYAAVGCLILGPEVAFTQNSDNFTDLTSREVNALPQAAGEPLQADEHVLSNPWWMNFDISGFIAAGYYDTGSNATRPIGTFEIKEASLFVSASVWEDADIFLELQTNRLGKDNQLFIRTGEVYIHLRNIGNGTGNAIGLKLGRIDIPFGEEYLWQDAIDNPLITNSASYPYGWDEGVLAYGNFNRISWIAALMDGTDQRSEEDNSDKALAFKFYSDVSANLYLSASMMTNGQAAKSAVEFGGSHFEPIGASHASTLPSSPSVQVDARLYQIDVKYDFLNSNESKRAYIAFAIGSRPGIGSLTDAIVRQDLGKYHIDHPVAIVGRGDPGIARHIGQAGDARIGGISR